MCGIFGAVTPGMDAAGIAALGVFSLQHRGQESAGLAVSDGEQLMLYKELGLIAQVLDVTERETRRALDRALGEIATAANASLDRSANQPASSTPRAPR